MLNGNIIYIYLGAGARVSIKRVEGPRMYPPSALDLRVYNSFPGADTALEIHQ